MRLALSIVLVAMLCSCGFHLRGTQGFELNVRSVNVAAANAYGELSRELERSLRAQKIEVTSSSEAEYNIRIASERTSRRPVATSGDISVSEYEVQLTVSFEVFNAAAEVVIEPTTLVTERIYSFDQTSLVGNSEEEELLAEEMRRDLAGQILRRFGATLRNLPKDDVIQRSETAPNKQDFLPKDVRQ